MWRRVRRLGFDVDRAANGEEGLRFFEKGKYAVVVTDLEMPKMGGRQLIHKIRHAAPEQKILVYTGESLNPEAKQRIGADACYTPEDYSELKKALGGIRANLV